MRRGADSQLGCLAMSRVLIVDDDWRILQLLGDGLKQDYAVETAMNAGEALAAIQRQRPDLVLADVMLPGASGIHLLNQIKRTDPTIEVVIITGSGNTVLERQALESGAAGFIRKPFDLNDLERRVAQIVGRK
jgi:DNA-binding NtrC family response regulator